MKARLRRGLPVVVDSTNVETDVRRALIKLADRYGRFVHAVRILPPLGVCLRRNVLRPRSRQVPPETVRRQHELAEAADVDVLRAEGFITAHDLYPPTALITDPATSLDTAALPPA